VSAGETEEMPLRGSTKVHFVAFAVLLGAAIALGLGGLALLGRAPGSPIGLFWASIVLSAVALVLGVVALVRPRRR